MADQKGVVVPTVVQILAIGDANAEIVFPQLQKMPGFGREVIVPGMKTRAAGSATNFAICAGSLGVKTGFAGRLAVDQFGEVVLLAFRAADVDTQCLRLVEEGSTGITIVIVGEDGERAFITYQGTNAEVHKADLEQCLNQDPPPRWVHLAGYHLLDTLRGRPSKDLLKLAQSRGATTSFDTGWDPSGWSQETVEEVIEILDYVDVFFPNADEVKALTGKRSPRKGAQQLIDAGAPALAVKLGKKGCLLATKRDQHLIPGFDVEANDTTAAGDAFDAGFAVSMVSGTTMGRAAVFANAVAALRVSRQPDQTLFPSLQETTAFLMRKRPLEI